MINRIKAFFAEHESGPTTGQAGRDQLELAAAALLVEAAQMDAGIDAAERRTITRLVGERFSLSPDEAETLVSSAESKAAQSSQLFGFTKTIKDRFSYDQRIELVEMLWEVIYADGRLHAFESNLMRRVAGLLHVPDQESGAARKRVLARREAGSTPAQS